MKYSEDEKKCIRIIAKWFRENRGFVNRSEAIKELGVDDRYDVLIKLMEHNGVVEKVRSVMGKDGYAIAFKPSAYAEELVREFDTEDKRLNKDREFGGDDVRDDDWRKDFMRFLAEKGWSEIYSENENRKTMSIDLSIRHPESKKLIGLIDLKERINRKIESKAKALFAQFANLELGRYLVTPSTEKSNYSFTIYKYSDRGLVRMQPNDFPTYDDLINESTKTDASGGEGANYEFENEEYRYVFRDNLVAFLITEKKFPRESLNHGMLAEDPDLDLTVAHPDIDSSLATFNFKYENNETNLPKLSGFMAKIHKKGFAGKYNPFVYMVYPSKESNEEFVIFEVEDDGTSNEISYEDFPIYDQLLFASPLSAPGRRIYRELIRLAKDKHGFSVHTPCQDYIDLQIKKNKRTAAQIHRLEDSDDNISLVLAGYQKDLYPAFMLNFVVRGDIYNLSGYSNKYPGEKNWLDGNLGHPHLKYKASVYVLKPGVLVLEDIEKEVGNLLELAKKNAERDKKPVYGNIVTAVGDRPSVEDLLGRDDLVNALAKMFVHNKDIEGFTVALLGDWGEGKSTVMRLLENRLTDNSRDSFEFATFNAWEYEHTDNIAAGLAQEVVKGLCNKLGFLERFKLWYRFVCREYKSIILFPFFYVVCLVFALVLWVKLSKDGLAKNLGLTVGSLGIAIYIFCQAKQIIEHPLADKLKTFLRLPNYRKHLGLVPILRHHVESLCSIKLNYSYFIIRRKRFLKILGWLRGIHRKQNRFLQPISFLAKCLRRGLLRFTLKYIRRKPSYSRLILFIDDLDRCQTDCITETLDAIRLVMTIPNVIVMIGIDHRIAFKAVENSYRKLGDGERTKADIARDYLGKIIQLPIRLVPVNSDDLRKYVNNRLYPNAFRQKDTETPTPGSTGGGGEGTKPPKPRRRRQNTRAANTGTSQRRR